MLRNVPADFLRRFPVRPGTEIGLRIFVCGHTGAAGECQERCERKGSEEFQGVHSIQCRAERLFQSATQARRANYLTKKQTPQTPLLSRFYPPRKCLLEPTQLL